MNTASQHKNYTNQARRVSEDSQNLVRSHRHNQLDVDHILLALLEPEEGVPSRILSDLGVSSDSLATHPADGAQVGLRDHPDSPHAPRPVAA